MKRIIAATAVAAMLTVTGVASAAKCPTQSGTSKKGYMTPCLVKSC
jgi:hypothetical protein